MCCPGAYTAYNGVKNVVKGFAYLIGGINEELGAERLKICHNCPKLSGGVACTVCGCEVHAKTRVPNESCPIGKWCAEEPKAA